VPSPGLGDGGDHLPGYADASSTVVPSYLVHHEPEERCERPGLATNLGTENLRDCLVVVAQIAASNGQAGS